MATDIGTVGFGRQSYGTTGRTGNTNRVLEDVIGVQSSMLPSLYSAKESKRRADEYYTLENNKLDAQIEVANKELTLLAERSSAEIASNEDISAKRLSLERQLSDARMQQERLLQEESLSQAKTESAIGQGVGGLGTVISGVTAYKTLFPTKPPVPGTGPVGEMGAGMYPDTMGASTAEAIGIEGGSAAIGAETAISEGFTSGATLEAGGNFGTAAGAGAVGAEAAAMTEAAGSAALAFETGGAVAADAAATTVASGVGSVIGGVATAVPYYAAAKAGGMLVESIDSEGTALSTFGESLDQPLNVERTWLHSIGVDNSVVNTTLDVLNPLGWVERKCCFIFVASHGFLHPIVRRYRDEHMTVRNRRGYYWFADRLVPLMTRYKVVSSAVKWLMVEPMTSYGRYHYGIGKMGALFAPLTQAWLTIFTVLGMRKPYKRRGTEEVV
jgi:hypothetical protein